MRSTRRAMRCWFLGAIKPVIQNFMIGSFRRLKKSGNNTWKNIKQGSMGNKEQTMAKRFRDLQANVRTPKQIADANLDAESILLEMNLRALRESRNKTQQEMAQLIEKTQPQLSQIES